MSCARRRRCERYLSAQVKHSETMQRSSGMATHAAPGARTAGKRPRSSRCRAATSNPADPPPARAHRMEIDLDGSPCGAPAGDDRRGRSSAARACAVGRSNARGMARSTSEGCRASGNRRADLTVVASSHWQCVSELRSSVISADLVDITVLHRQAQTRRTCGFVGHCS